MGNLFFVFTPLQLFVAQQIIRQEKLENNVMLVGYSSLFNNVYEMMKLERLWKKTVYFEELAHWNGDRVRTFSDVKGAYSNYKRIKNLLKENKIGTIYLGEILNQACRFTDIVFHRQGYKIVFFEEGTSHYVNRPYVEDKSLSHIIKKGLLDAFYFMPFYGIRFAEWNSSPNRSYEELPIDKRFSMIPYHHESYDVRLYVEPMFSERLKDYAMSNVREEEGKHRVMLMTDPLRELIPKEYLYLYFDTIKECIENIGDNQFLYIKFHPREIQSSRDKILNLAKDSGKRFKVLSDEVNICVEYYLQLFHFEKIFFFNAATYFYYGYAFPKMDFVKLMPVVYKKCKEAGVKNLVYMENMLKMINVDYYKR
jgi:hypothetical protein